MTLHTMLRAWLRWLRPVSRPLPMVLALPAPTPLVPMRPNATPNARQWIEIEALMLLPTVEPDYGSHIYPPDTANLVDGGAWLAHPRRHPRRARRARRARPAPRRSAQRAAAPRARPS